MAAPKTANVPLFRRYNTLAPVVKPAIADRIRAVEAAARPPRAVNAKCCGRCKTPYNCGRPGCPCHR